MLSFVVPAYNEELELPDTIQAIQSAASGYDYEIVVVDDASTDRTPDLARAAGAKLVSIRRRQIAAARNAGAENAKGEVLFFVDADTRINSKHVAGAINALGHGYVGGGAQVKVEETIPRWAQFSLRCFCYVYFAFNLAIGFYYKSKAGKNISEFFLSGRNVPWWLAGTSMVATTFAADTPLAVTGMVARNGIAGNWLWWNSVASGMLTVFLFARLWRRYLPARATIESH